MAGSAKKRHARLPLDPRVRAVLVYGAMVFLFALWQAAPHGFPVIGGGRPLLLLPLTVSVAMFTGPAGGAAVGTAAGLLWDLTSERLFGAGALLFLLIGCTVGLLARLLLRNNWLSALLLHTGSTVLALLLDWIFFCLLPGRAGAVWLLCHTMLPCALYTLVLALPIYGLVRLAAHWLLH